MQGRAEVVRMLRSHGASAEFVHEPMFLALDLERGLEPAVLEALGLDTEYLD